MPAVTASVRVRAPSFVRTDATWNFTVWREIFRRAAIVRLLIPSAIISRTSSSRAVTIVVSPGASDAAAVEPETPAEH